MAVGFVAPIDGNKNYPGKLTGHVFLICVVAAMGGLIFGYDLGISGGVTSMPSFLKEFFPDVYKKETTVVASSNQYCKFNSQKLTFFTSSLYLAALVSSCIASRVTRAFGRKFSMVSGGIMFLVGSAFNGFAKNVGMLYVGRLFLGFGIGFANQSTPVYLSETAPYKYRGGLNMLFQLTITIGILAANIVNYATAKIQGGWGWRVSLGCAAVPAVIFIVGSIFLPDTPNSLIERGQREEAKEKLKSLRGIDNVDDEFADLILASEESKKIENQWQKILERRNRPQLTFAILIPFFQQFTGMNVFMFYAPVLFKTMGFGDNASLMSTVITGLVNTISTFVSIFTVDRVGRRALFIEGGLQLLICQIFISAGIGWKFGFKGNPGTLPHWFATCIVLLICIYVAGFAWSWGPLGWLIPSEIFPLEVRSAGQSINVMVNMICTFIIAEIFIWLMCTIRFGLFIFFAMWVIIMTWFIWKFLPETKGVPIEEMGYVWSSHPYWKKFVPSPQPPTKEMSTRGDDRPAGDA
ncbi:hypothetical protein Leryth_003236 [Lithospermum erythrorhizon]|nr:hypothetical protein Leryth_003236 [Lithospermum erythrorhizon]